MKAKHIFAAAAALSLCTTLAVSASAEDIFMEKAEPTTIASEDNLKWPLGIPDGNTDNAIITSETIDTVEVTVTTSKELTTDDDFNLEVAYNHYISEDEVGWSEIGKSLNQGDMTIDGTTITAEYDFTTLGEDTKQGVYGVLNIHYWSEAAGNIEITDVKVNGESIMGREFVPPEDDEEDEDEGETEDETPEEVTETEEETPAVQPQSTETSAAATTNPTTGAAVSLGAAGLTVAAAAVLKKKK